MIRAPAKRKFLVSRTAATLPPLRKPNVTLALLALSYLMMVADGSIVVTALPQIHRGLHFSIAGLSWVQSAYLLAGGGMLLLGARIGDIFGRRRMFVIGLAAFMISSLAAGVSLNATWLICARFAQGLASAVLAPSTLALLSTSFPTNPSRGRALAIYGSITGIGTAVGLVVGGMITTLLSWNWAFIINVPLGLVLLWLAPRHLLETPRRKLRIDYWGAITSTVGMLSLVFGIVRSSDTGWTNPATLTFVSTGIAVMLLFVWIQEHVTDPIVPTHLLKNRERSGANTARFLFVGAMTGFWFFLAQYLENTRHLSPFGAGLAFLPMTLASFAVAFLVPRLSRRFGDVPFLVGGLLTVGLGTLWISFLGEHSNYLTTIALPMLLIGLGQGASTIRLTTAAIAGVSPDEAGAASGVMTTAVQLGGALGLSVLVAFAASTPTHVTTALLMTKRAHLGLGGGAFLIAIALIVVLIFVVPRERGRHSS